MGKHNGKTRNSWLLALFVILLVAASVYWGTNALRDGALTEIQALYATGDHSEVLSRIEAKTESGTASGLDLLAAAGSARKLANEQRFRTLLKSATSAGIAEDSVELEERLFAVTNGESKQSPTRAFRGLLGDGVIEEEALFAALNGALLKSDHSSALRLVDAADVSSMESPDVELMLAKLAFEQASGSVSKRGEGKRSEAIAKCKQVLRKHPRHELSFLALEDMLRKDEQVDAAKLVLKHVVEQFPKNASAELRYAKQLRADGQTTQAADILQRLRVSGDLQADEMDLETIWTSFSQGEYSDALKKLAAEGFRSPEDFSKLSDEMFRLTMEQKSYEADPLVEKIRIGAISMALLGDTERSAALFEGMLTKIARLRRYIDLVPKKSIFGEDPGLNEAIRKVLDLNEVQPKIGVQTSSTIEESIASLPGYELYLDNCANCHGALGDGKGRSSRHLFPLPRDFRREPLRYVSGLNALPLREDIVRATSQGLQGTSMLGFDGLSEKELQQVVDVVVAFREAGLNEVFDLLEIEGREDLNVSAWVSSRLLAAEAMTVPVELLTKTNPLNEDELLKAKELLASTGCNQCHAASLEDPTKSFFDSAGQPLAPRNFKTDPFRYGNDIVELFKRIALGIPGTPHPAFAGSTEDAALLAFFLVQQQNQDSILPSTNHQRRLKASIESN